MTTTNWFVDVDAKDEHAQDQVKTMTESSKETIDVEMKNDTAIKQDF